MYDILGHSSVRDNIFLSTKVITKFVANHKYPVTEKEAKYAVATIPSSSSSATMFMKISSPHHRLLLFTAAYTLANLDVILTDLVFYRSFRRPDLLSLCLFPLPMCSHDLPDSLLEE